MHGEATRSQSDAVASPPSVTVGGIDIAWQLDAGTVTFEGIPVIMAWTDSTLAGLMQGVHAMVGTKRFALALQAEGRRGVYHDWQVISAAPTFSEGFRKLASIASVAGWGRWELVDFDPDVLRCRFRVYNSWEGHYQKALGVTWGSAMVAGKFAGYCSKLRGFNCWAEQTHYACKGDAYDEFVVTRSERSVEDELERLLASDDATRADMAVALRRLRKEIASRERIEARLRLHEDVVHNMRTGLHVYHLEDPADDRTLRFISTNPQGEELLGFGSDELVGKLIDDCFPRARDVGLAQAYARLAINGESLDLGDVHYEDDRLRGWYRVRGFGLPGCRVGITFDDVTSAKEAERDLVTSQERLRSLGKHLEAARESERQQIAHLLDEELGQMLAAVRLGLNAPCAEEGSCQERDRKLVGMVDSAIETLRHVSLELRPPELVHLGLSEAIRAECDRTRERRGLDIVVTGAFHDEALDKNLAITLFRMIGAVVRDVADHAQRLDILLQDERYTLQLFVDVRLKEGSPLPPSTSPLLLTELRERVTGWDGQVSVVPLDACTSRFMITVPAQVGTLTEP